MSSSKDWSLDCKVYVGEIGYGAAKQELEDVFCKFGPLKNVWVARNPPGFAFVEFEDPRDARDACESIDGTRINGRRARVEMSSGKSRWGSRGPPVRRGGGGYRGGRDRPRQRSRSRSPSYRRRSTSPYYRRRSPSPRRRYSRSRSPRDRSPRDRSPAARDRSPDTRARSSDKDRDRSPYDDDDRK